MRRDEVGPGDDDFENGAAVLTEQVDFVNDYQPNSLNYIFYLECEFKPFCSL